MNNLWRALRIALRYRVRFAFSVITALLVAVLWGANISSIYPMIEIVVNDQSPDQWVAMEIERAAKEAMESQAVVATEEIHRLHAAADPKIVEKATLAINQALAFIDAQTAAPVATRTRLKAELQKSLAAVEQSNTKWPAYDATAQHRARTRMEAELRAIVWREWLQTHVVPHLPHGAFRTVALVVGLLILGTVLKGLFMVANSILTSGIVSLATLELRNQFYRRTLKMDQATFTTDGTSDLMSRFTFDMEILSQGLKLLCSSAMLEPFKMFACLAGAAFVSWRLLLFSLIVAPLGFLLIRKLSRILKHANRRAMEGMSRIYALLEETFQGIAVVKAFTMERQERRRFHQENKSYYFKSMRIARYDSLTSPVTEWLGMVMISFTLLAGLYLAVNKETHLLGIPLSDRPPSIASLLLFYGLLAGISDPARKMSGIISRVQRASAAADRIYALIDRPANVKDPAKPRPLARPCKQLEFRHVQFCYRPGVPVLEDINLTIPFGQKVALVGGNGSGKSSLANLVPRFYDPTQGEILLDGVNLRDVKMSDLRSHIGLVTQEPILFNDTVMNNIRYGSPHATEMAAIAAAKKAHAHKFITEKLPEGYDTHVGERGKKLSGGQRQRIALARAILRDPALLILDEATSQIDIESEQLIHMVLEEFMKNRTTFLITHRMSTLSLVDRIVVLDHGRIVDQGTHDMLVRRCSYYQRLFREAA